MSELPVDLSEDALEKILISLHNSLHNGPMRAYPKHMIVPMNPDTPYHPYAHVGVIEVEDES